MRAQGEELLVVGPAGPLGAATVLGVLCRSRAGRVGRDLTHTSAASVLKASVAPASA
jgi:hypothetical protein